jgi:hypothetical protein
MNNNSNVNIAKIPGMIYPTQQGMLAGSPRDSAIASMNLTNSKLSELQSVGGRRRYMKNIRKRGGSSGKIIVPQFNMLYTSAGGPGQTPNDIIKQNVVIGTQGAENAQFDKLALVKGGGVYMNPNTNQYQWGCYSGGKKSKKSRKSNKSKKSRKSRKSKKSRKSRK